MRKENDSESPLVTLSIVSHGDAGKIPSLLDSLHRFEGIDRLQVIITDNLENDVPEPNGFEWQSLTMVRNKKPLGFASNHNQAFQWAKGRYYCILNPDVAFEQEIFPTLVKWLEIGRADIIAPLIVDQNAVPQDSYRNFPTPFEIIRRRLPGYRFIPPAADGAGLVEPDWIAGIFMLMRSETYLNIKGFDEKYRLYFEDVDFCARARLAGSKIMVDTNIRIQHNAHRASRKKPIYLLWHVRSAVRFFTSSVYIRAIQSKK
jgi:GT2 family glycosyltransferase